MPAADILSEEFMEAIQAAALRARQAALSAGHPVVFLDEFGRYVQELPNGTKLEVRFRPGFTGDDHLEVIGELHALVK